MKILNIFFVALAFFGLSIGAVDAQTWNIGSPTASSVTATYNSGTLTISGIGKMESWLNSSSVPWRNQKGSITTVIIDEGITNIGGYAFYGCSLLAGAATIPNSINTIAASAFSNCVSLTSVTIPSSVTSIGNYAFYNCTGVTTVNFNATNCTAMGSYLYPVFEGCILFSTLNIGSNVTKIPPDFIRTCSGLTSVTIPNLVTSIGGGAFDECIGLTELIVEPTTPPQLGPNAFGSVPANIPVYVACQSHNAYQNSDWGNYYFNNFQSEFQYVVDIQSNDNSMGSVSFVQQPSCKNNGTAIIKATANNCHRFVKWNDNNTSNPRTVNVTDNMSFTAIFEPTNYTIAVQSNNTNFGQAVILQEPTCQNNYQAIIQATANSGYRFVKWNDNNTSNPRTINVTSNGTFTAIFEVSAGIDDILLKSISIYPNPVKEELIISSENKIEKIEICDLAGKVHSTHSTKTINVSALLQGVYLVKIHTDKGVVTQKLVKN